MPAVPTHALQIEINAVDKYEPDGRGEHCERLNDIDGHVERVLADGVMAFHEACEGIHALPAP